MLRAGAKNFPSCAVVYSPAVYGEVLKHIEENDGCTTFNQRLELAANVFGVTTSYDSLIIEFMAQQMHIDLDGIKECYEFTGGGE